MSTGSSEKRTMRYRTFAAQQVKKRSFKTLQRIGLLSFKMETLIDEDGHSGRPVGLNKLRFLELNFTQS